MATFTNTLAALAIYDAGAEQRQDAWDAVNSVIDLDSCVHAERAAQGLVQEAFHRDTAAFNSLEQCRLLDVASIRHVATMPTQLQEHAK